MIFQKILTALVTKKRLIKWVSALALAVGAAVASMQTSEFKAIVCDAPALEAEVK